MDFFKKNKWMSTLAAFLLVALVIFALNTMGGADVTSGATPPVPIKEQVEEDSGDPASIKPVSTPQDFSITGLPPKTDAPAPTATQIRLTAEVSTGMDTPSLSVSGSQATATLPGTDASASPTANNQSTQAPSGTAAPITQPAEATPPKNAPPPPTPKKQSAEAPPPGNGGPPSP